METVLFLAIAFAIGYVVIYTPVGKMLGISESDSAASTHSKASGTAQGNAEQLVVPEDSALKRHFFAQLRTDIESELAPRPTCSMLKRHHDALILVEMDNRLQAA